MLRPSALVLTSLTIFGCSPAPTTTTDPLEDAPPVLAQYGAVLHAGYEDSVVAATELHSAIDLLAEGTPTADALAQARLAWIAARQPYMQTEVSRFYGGPIDDPDVGPEGLVNSWPLDERYIDYVVGPSDILYDGIVNDPTLLPEVTEAGLEALNQQGETPEVSEVNVSVGYHPIEFLLWGQDLSATGPGERPFTDYLLGDPAGMNQDRRRAYLDAASELLTDHLTDVRDAWAPDTAGNYRAEFEALPPREGLRRILLGMGSLSGGELSGQRINVPYTTKDQNDEHSCFSDTTLQDHYYDALGIQNVYLGRYVRTDGTMVSGPSLSDMVRARDPELDARFRMELEESIAAIQAIPAPFDQAILGADSAPGRVAILAAINALRGQTASIVEIADLFDITLNLE
jgi:putative iron-regulated protein